MKIEADGETPGLIIVSSMIVNNIRTAVRNTARVVSLTTKAKNCTACAECMLGCIKCMSSACCTMWILSKHFERGHAQLMTKRHLCSTAYMCHAKKTGWKIT